MTQDPFDGLTPIQPDTTVTPFRKVKKARQRQSQELLRLIRKASDVEPSLDVPYLIKGVIAPNSMAVVYGPANVGKSFLALDMAHAIARGAPWFGCKVTAAPVLYVTLEGGAGFDRRVAALDQPCFYTLAAPLRFMVASRDPTYLAEAIEMMAEETGPFGLIVIDTLARAMAGGDENSAKDMAAVIASAELLKERTGACVLMVHHTGKNSALGARGHSSLRAAVDTEIEVTKEDDDDIIEAKATKQRDMVVGKVIRYRLREVVLGQDQDGDDVTTCVVERAAEGEEPRRASVKGKAAIALQALSTAIERHGLVRTGPDYPTARSVTKDQWRDCAEVHGMFEGMAEKSIKPSFNRALAELNDKGLARCFNEIWWLASSRKHTETCRNTPKHGLMFRSSTGNEQAETNETSPL